MTEDELRKENEELKQRVETLRRKLRAANNKLAAYTHRASLDYRDQQDYLPYEEDDRR